MKLFLEYQPRIYGYIRSLLYQKSDADDVMQETASLLWKRFSEFKPETHFDRWAFRVAFYQVRKFRQAKAREGKRFSFSDEVLEMLSEDAGPILEETEVTVAALEQCLRKLPEQDRYTVGLRYKEGATNRSVAQEIGKSESVVSRNLSRIYDTLMRCIALQLKLEREIG